jgi:hypothetical protein
MTDQGRTLERMTAPIFRRVASDRRPPRGNVTAILMGDPPPGRSALDKLNAKRAKEASIWN